MSEAERREADLGCRDDDAVLGYVNPTILGKFKTSSCWSVSVA